MQIKSLTIHNFKSIRRMYIPDIENALILVGQNNTGKTTVLDAIRAVGGAYAIRPEDFNEEGANIEIAVSIEYTEDDLMQMQKAGLVSSYHRFEAWKEDFCKKQCQLLYSQMPSPYKKLIRAYNTPTDFINKWELQHDRIGICHVVDYTIPRNKWELQPAVVIL